MIENHWLFAKWSYDITAQFFHVPEFSNCHHQRVLLLINTKVNWNQWISASPHDLEKFALSLYKILVEFYWCKCRNLIGWAIAHYQPLLVYRGWISFTNDDVFSFCQSFGGNFWWKWITKFLKRLIEGHFGDTYGFLTLKKKVEIIEKNDTRVHNFNFEWQFKPNDSSKAQSLIIRQEITGKRYLNLILVRIQLKQLDYSLSISMTPHSILELII